MSYINTKKRGIARIIIFPFGKNSYRAVCLDFDLIEDAKTIEQVEHEIRESVMGYVENVCINNLPDELLNRHADQKYWKILKAYQKYMASKRVIQNFSRNVEKSSFLSLPIRSLCPTG